MVLFSIFGCSTKTYMFMGDKLYREGKLYKSCERYSKAYAKCKSSNREEKGEIAERVGDIYCLIKNNKKAYLWYKKSLLSRCKEEERAKKVLELAYVLNKNNEIKRIEDRYGVFINRSNLPQQNVRYLLKPFDQINTRFDDFGISFKGRDTTFLFFTSNRKLKRLKNQRKSPVSNDYSSHIYVTEFTDEIIKKRGGIEEPEYLEDFKWIKPVIIKDSMVNSEGTDGVMSFDSSGKNVFYTTSRRENGVYVSAKIYSATLNSKLKFSNVKKLKIVNDTIPIGHPAISPDGNTLFFSSRMQGGYGKSDIWYSVKAGDKWSRPVNAGDVINTAGDEVYPSFDLDGNLFIASDRNGGYGGLDIYKVDGEYGNYILNNVGSPINSRADDFGIVYYHQKDKGFFSSSRNKRGDVDVFYFEKNPYRFTIEVSLVDKKSNAPIVDANLIMTDTNGKYYKIKSDEKGYVRLSWNNRSSVSFILQKKGYLKKSFQLDTQESVDDMNYSKSIALDRIDNVIEIPNIFYAFGKANLTDSSKESLKELVTVLNDNPNITIEIGAHTDMVGDAEDNTGLSYARAKSVIDFLIQNNICANRLTPKGYGESMPKTVSKEDENKYHFLRQGQKLTPVFVESLSGSQLEIVNQLNRRTEFRVLRTDYTSNEIKD